VRAGRRGRLRDWAGRFLVLLLGGLRRGVPPDRFAEVPRLPAPVPDGGTLVCGAGLFRTRAAMITKLARTPAVAKHLAGVSRRAQRRDREHALRAVRDNGF
jgi:hypothetical protein